MIKIDKIACLDLEDDLEALSLKENKNFSIHDLIEGDESKAFALGYCYDNLVKNGSWFSPKSRKELRHIADDIQSYNDQLKWINEKYGAQQPLDYVNCIMDNLFCDNPDHRLAICILLGKQLSDKKFFDE